MKLIYSVEPEILGTGGGIKNAESLLGHEPFLLINSDIVCDVDLQKVIHYHFDRNADATMVVRREPVLKNFDEIKLNRSFEILSINNRPTHPKTFIPRLFIGIHVLNPIVFDYLQKKFSSVITDFYQKALNDRRRIVGYDFDGFWSDVGTKESLIKINSEVLPFEI